MGNGIALYSSDNIYVTGETNSKDFPTKNAFQPQPKAKGASRTGFVTKLNPAGNDFIYSTYLGGSGGNDYPTARPTVKLRPTSRQMCNI